MTGDPQLTPHQQAQRKRMMYAAVALAIGVVAMLALGGPPTAGLDGVGGGARKSGALNTGQMSAFVYKATPEPLPPIKFVDGAGKERSLSDWRGRAVLLNLWATWCAPCRKEMPDLDRLQSLLGGKTFEVVAISVDRAGLEASRKFLDQTGTKSLALYADPTAQLASLLKVPGLPATLLIDAEGREIGRLLGPAEWAGDDATKLIRSVVR